MLGLTGRSTRRQNTLRTGSAGNTRPAQERWGTTCLSNTWFKFDS
jgi:hypothetical protein